jgi:predicted anti-sigma-YlaC factor YlaD
MTCGEVRERLHEMVERGASQPDGPLAEHLATCRACAGWHAAVKRFGEGLRALDAPRPPDGFAERVAAQVHIDRFARARARRRWVAAAALAASLLLTVSLGYSLRSKKNAVFNPGPPAADNGDKAGEPTPSPRASVAEAGDAVAALSRRATDETVEQTRLLWPVVSAPISFEGVDLSTPLDPSAQSLREAGQNVSTGLEPVTTSARRAVNLFWRDLPPVEPAKKQGS